MKYVAPGLHMVLHVRLRKKIRTENSPLGWFYFEQRSFCKRGWWGMSNTAQIIGYGG